MQNEQVAETLNLLVDASGAHFETAGSMRKGRSVFVTMKLPTAMQIAGVDDMDLYLAATTSHDGTASLRLDATPYGSCARTRRPSPTSARAARTRSGTHRTSPARSRCRSGPQCPRVRAAGGLTRPGTGAGPPRPAPVPARTPPPEPQTPPPSPHSRHCTHRRPDVQRSLKRENDSAAILADLGYRLHQNPSKQEVETARFSTGDVGETDKDPDYLIEGHVFGCYSPKPERSVRGVWTGVQEKVDDGQTQRVVLNLQDWKGDLDALHQQFDNWPINGLKEMVAISPGGTIIQIVPRP